MTSEIITFNTTTGLHTLPTNVSADPWHNLPAKEWVQKQIDWANQSEPSGLGLIEPISKLGEDLVGVEIGVCLGSTTQAFLKQIPTIKKLYAVDNYPSYIDWNGTDINEERQSLMKQYAKDLLTPFGDKVEFCYESSGDFATRIYRKEEECFDFVFIDGDHSEEASYRDFCNYYLLVKKGGIFAGHDIFLPGVFNSLNKFLGEKINKVVRVQNTAWYLIKE
jgi:predicted O-methyltransferase YrrM